MDYSLSLAFDRFETDTYVRETADALDTEESVPEDMDGIENSWDVEENDRQRPIEHVVEQTGSFSVTAASSKAEKDKRRRQMKRREKREELFWSRGQPPAEKIARVISHMEAVDAHIRQGSIENLPSAACGYQASREGAERTRRVRTLDDALKDGYRLIKWDGVNTKVIATEAKRVVIGVCVGRNQDEKWARVGEDAFSAISRAAVEVSELNMPRRPNPRGNFSTLLTGILHGHGSKEAHQVQTGRYTNVIQKLTTHEAIRRLAGFASASFNTFAPKLYSYYHDRMNALNIHSPSLKRPFNRSVFACAGFNIGEQVAAFMHRDCMNCPFGWCAVHALGRFNPMTGGHMLLDDLKLAIEFPPNSLMLIPSAIIKHGNAAVAEGELRASFTQFSPGNLFRFIDCGFQTEASLKLSDEEKYGRMMDLKRSRWRDGIGLWSTVDELHAIAKEISDGYIA
ncbi:hypothetical protein CVT24_004166 [Panaeolus cyanescens]|uniref:Uncharacterized protein n=1 Tax=Panaeolus cyanescens TaxID=181874 RepID=A0A409YXB6_9AGAR|nr:hypothetical protein CVT24_004166 [Panaeolus cyanescens]